MHTEDMTISQEDLDSSNMKATFNWYGSGLKRANPPLSED